MIAPTNRATVKEMENFFGKMDGQSWILELKELKAAPSAVGNANAYDDIAIGIGNGTLTY